MVLGGSATSGPGSGYRTNGLFQNDDPYENGAHHQCSRTEYILDYHTPAMGNSSQVTIPIFCGMSSDNNRPGIFLTQRNVHTFGTGDDQTDIHEYASSR